MRKVWNRLVLEGVEVGAVLAGVDLNSKTIMSKNNKAYTHFKNEEGGLVGYVKTGVNRSDCETVAPKTSSKKWTTLKDANGVILAQIRIGSEKQIKALLK